MPILSLRSQIARKLLGYFFLNPEQDLYVNEIARKLEVDKRNLVKMLKDLETEGLLMSQRRGNIKLYALNPAYPLLEEFRRIFMKTSGLEARLREAVRRVPGIKEAYIYGSYARDAMHAQSDIDLLVVGGHRIPALQKELNRLQSETNREVNCVHMSEEEFRRRKVAGDPFLEDVFCQKTIALVPWSSTTETSPGTGSRRHKSVTT